MLAFIALILVMDDSSELIWSKELYSCIRRKQYRLWKIIITIGFIRNSDFWIDSLMDDDFEWFLIEIFCKNLQSLLFLLSYSLYYDSNILLLTPIDIRRELFWILKKEGVAIWKNWFKRIIFYENRPDYDSISIS